MKVAIYVRVSRRDLNPENQLNQLVEHAKVKGWDYTVFEEIESTRKTRPIKEEVLTLLRKGKLTLLDHSNQLLTMRSNKMQLQKINLQHHQI